MLHALIRDHGLNMASIEKLSADEVKQFAQKVGISTSKKSIRFVNYLPSQIHITTLLIFIS